MDVLVQWWLLFLLHFHQNSFKFDTEWMLVILYVTDCVNNLAAAVFGIYLITRKTRYSQDSIFSALLQYKNHKSLQIQTSSKS